MSSPHGTELEGGVWKEHVVSSNDSRDVVRWSSVDHAAVVAIECERPLELGEVESSVTRLVVSGDEKLALVEGWVHADGVEPA